MKKRLVLRIIVIAAGIFSIPVFSYAETTTTPATAVAPATPATTGDPTVDALNTEIQARKDKIAELEKTIANYQANINQKQTQSASLKNQLSILDQQNQVLSVQIAETLEKINQATLELRILGLSIEQKTSNINRQKKIVAKLIQSLNADSRKQLLEILISQRSFGDFYTNLTSLEYVYSDVGRSVKALRLETEALAAEQQKVEITKAHYHDLEKELENQKDKLDEQSAYKQKLLADTKSSESQYRTLVSSLQKQYQVVINEQKTYEDKLRAELAARNKIVASSDLSLNWPVPSHVINALFHDSDYPFRNVFEHTGLDIRASYGTPIRAAAAGYVARAKRCTTASCYAYVMIIHTSNISTVYGHASKILVDEDQYVNRGDIIAMSGGTPGTAGAGPFVTGPHLHFEVRLNGIPVDPLGYLIQ